MVIRQISSLEKVRQFDPLTMPEITALTALKGERVSYQIGIHSEKFGFEALEVQVHSPLEDHIQLYRVEQAVMDYPVYPSCEEEKGYLTKEPGLMPDILRPMEECGNLIITEEGKTSCVWVCLDIPEDAQPGTYEIQVEVIHKIIMPKHSQEQIAVKVMQLTVLDMALPEQTLLYTQWFHADSIANEYAVEPYTPRHWELIDRYMAAARYTGINMLLVPIFTPPVDTRFQHCRTNIQLIDVRLENGQYRFGFDKVRKWLSLCRKNGIFYFEISHLFTQWGGHYAPNIFADTPNGKVHIFGWQTQADDPAYAVFLQQCIPQLVQVLKEEGADKTTYFHITDESGDVAQYERDCRILRPLIPGFKTMDATTSVEKYKEGFVDCPVPGTNRILSFIEAGVQEPWTYVCCGHYREVGNRFLSMASRRNRIAGLQMYRHGVKGYLHWGFNYYESFCSAYHINPYLTTSGDSSYPSGDPFSVYPGKDGAVLSLRAMVFYEGLQDMRRCALLEQYIGREAVCRMLDDAAGYTLTFKEYPDSDAYILELRDQMTQMLAAFVKE